jgi:AraC family transcriptional regulator
MGAEQSETIETTSFRVTRAWFPARAVLGKHTHDRATFAVMLSGGFRTDIASRQLGCDAGHAWTEPLGEDHANVCGAEGARVVVVQPDRAGDELLAPMRALFDEVHLLRHPNVVAHARRVARELERRDALTAVAVDALSVSMLAEATRLRWRDGNGNTIPRWLSTARDMLHDEWRRGLTVQRIARAAGVHPAHFARMFRRYYHSSVGSYVRGLRLEWAVRELERDDRPVSAIAAEAGFSDQSHFTRECARRYGFTPAAHRRRRRQHRAG